LAIIDLTEGKKQPFARKVAVVAYYLEEHQPAQWTPHFLFTIIVPKQPKKVTDDWDNAKHFKLPSGFSLIKGTKEMFWDGVEMDIPPGFGGYISKLLSGNLKAKDFDNSVDGVVPSVLSALKEAKEEAGVKLKNIEVIFDLGVRTIKISGRNLRVNSFAIELKKPVNGKAIDSLMIKYFTLQELKLASKIRTRYNIPLVRPTHYYFVKNVFSILSKQYDKTDVVLSVKASSKKKALKVIDKCKADFSSIIKNAYNGVFIAYKYSAKKTKKNIIKKSVWSREKRKLVPQNKVRT